MRRMGGGLKPQLDNNIQVIPARDIGSGFCIGWQGLARLIEPSLLNWSAIFRRCLAILSKNCAPRFALGEAVFTMKGVEEIVGSDMTLIIKIKVNKPSSRLLNFP